MSKYITCGECGDRQQVDCYSNQKEMEDNKMCFTCNFWFEAYKKKDSPNSVRVGGVHYFIHEPGSTFTNGFSGRRFNIKFHDGRIVKTNNLWHQGEINKIWKSRLPDNAVFI